MKETAGQVEHRAKRKQDILNRITHALPDWSAERLEELATQMAALEIRSDARESNEDGPRRR